MSDHTTSPESAQDSEQFTVKGPPAIGFTILYNGNARKLISEHSAAIRCYLALCVYANGEGEAHPSLTTLATDINMDKKTVILAVRRLEDVGLLKVVRPKTNGRGKANAYYLLPPEKVAPTPPIATQKGGVQGGKKVAPTPPQQEVREQEETTPPSSPPEEEEPVRDYSDVGEVEGESRVVYPPQKQKAQAQPTNGAPQGGGGRVSNANQTWNGKEQEHPYWTEGDLGKYHRTCFDMTFKEYPKQINQTEAMTAWREIIGDRMERGEAAQEYKRFVWTGLQWWKAYWKEKGTEDRWIPTFANWILKERWAEAQVVAG